MRRILRAWREEGLAGIERGVRSDEGQVKISKDWQDFIVKTYREGNRGSQQISRSQVAVRVEVRAQQLGSRDAPSRSTVYRVLQPLIEQQQVKRSLGWRGERLTLQTREGLEIAIDRSNQVWQVDHTKVDVLVVDRGGEIIGRPSPSLS